jgi:hypothetical protein
MTEPDAYAAYLAAIADERTAIQMLLAADNAEPFVQPALDEANESWRWARAAVNNAQHAWYIAVGHEHNPERIRL